MFEAFQLSSDVGQTTGLRGDVTLSDEPIQSMQDIGYGLYRICCWVHSDDCIATAEQKAIKG